jgi:hypothetical protein
MATIIKIVYDVTNPVIKVTYDVTNITVAGNDIAPVYISLDYSSSSAVTVITSVGLTMPTGFSVANSPLTQSGTLAVTYAAGYSLPTTTKQGEWDQAYNDKINSASVTGTTTKTLTLNQQDGGTIQASWSDLNTDAVTSVFGRTGAVVATEGDYNLTQLGDVTLTSPTTGQVLKYNGTTWVNNTDTDTGLTSVGLSMPSAFAVANSPLTSNGTLAVTGAGTSAQYVRGDGQLANFPSTGGGGSSVNYYLNGSVSQGTFGGDTYYEMSKSPIGGVGTNFTRTNAQGNGYIASFITDAGDPALLNIPGGNWNLEFYFNASSGGGTPSFYAELYKVSSSNVFTLVASGSTNAEGITQGTVVDQYFTSIPVVQTSLLATDRIAIRIYVIPDGRNITLHTENSNLCEVLTTFSTGLNALNGLTAQVQYFATGTSGTDFNIQSLTDTHTFNLPVASGSNTGKLSNVDWLTFDGKENVLTFSAPLSRSVNTVSIPVATTSQPGYLDSTDWTTFNAKVTSVSATSPLFSSGGKTPTLTIQQASGSQNGYLSSTDWTTFNSKQPALSGTGIVKSVSGTISYLTDNSTNWNTSYDNMIVSAAVTGTTTKTLTLTQQDAGTITASWTDDNTDAVTSVFGRTGAVIATSGDYSTTLVTEGTNLYYTDVRVSANSDVAANTAARHNAVTLGTANGLSLSTQALSLGLSSSSTNGALSSTDWSTFNAKQNAITLTTTGTSGAATFISNTLNIPTITVAGLGAVPDGRTITINGEVFDLSANRTFEVGDYGTF